MRTKLGRVLCEILVNDLVIWIIRSSFKTNFGSGIGISGDNDQGPVSLNLGVPLTDEGTPNCYGFESKP